MADYKGVLVDLRSKRGALQDEIDKLDNVIDTLGHLVPEDSTPPQAGIQDFADLTSREAAEKYLTIAHDGLTTGELFNAIKARGFQSQKNALYNVLLASEKDEHGTFVREGRKWFLRNMRPNTSVFTTMPLAEDEADARPEDRAPITD